MNMTTKALAAALLAASTTWAQVAQQVPASFANQNFNVTTGTLNQTPGNANRQPAPVANGTTTLRAVEPVAGDRVLRDVVAPVVTAPVEPTLRPAAVPPPTPATTAGTTGIVPSTTAGTTGIVPSTTAGTTGIVPSTTAGTTGIVPSTTAGTTGIVPATTRAPIFFPFTVPGTTSAVTSSALGPAAPFGVPLGAPPPSFVTGESGFGGSTSPSRGGDTLLQGQRRSFNIGR